MKIDVLTSMTGMCATPVVIGADPVPTGMRNVVVIGNGSSVSVGDGLQLGHLQNMRTVVVGENNTVIGPQNIAIGTGIAVCSAGTIVIGNDAKCDPATTEIGLQNPSIVIGSYSEAASGAIAFGAHAYAGPNSIAIGHYADTRGSTSSGHSEARIAFAFGGYNMWMTADDFFEMLRVFGAEITVL